MATKKTLIDRLATAIKNDGRTQQEIADVSGVTQPTIHKILNRGRVTLDIAEKVAKGLRLKLELVEK